jgi:CheY-like chemotaxis protein
MALNLGSVDVHRVIHDVFEMIAPEAAEKGVDVRVSPEATAHIVRGDSTRLHQVLWNLMKNAVKFTPRGGQVRVTTEGVGREGLRIRVKDTGCGIDPAKLEDIFKPFEQASADLGGLGLGLSIVRGLVEAHGGRVCAESAGQDRGSLFVVDLPVLTQSSVEIHAPAADRDPHQPCGTALNILVVEDHNQIARMIHRLLEDEGYHVTVAGSIAEALRQEGPYDLLISDLGLPDGDGLTLMRELRKRGPINGIALSGYASERDVLESRGAGFDMHIAKPVDITTLLDAIHKLQPVSACGNGPPSR